MVDLPTNRSAAASQNRGDTRDRESTSFRRYGSGYHSDVFLFFSNRLGCLGSIGISVLVTLVVLAVLHWR